jgi:hypothetical protein
MRVVLRAFDGDWRALFARTVGTLPLYIPAVPFPRTGTGTKLSRAFVAWMAETVPCSVVTCRIIFDINFIKKKPARRELANAGFLKDPPNLNRQSMSPAKFHESRPRFALLNSKSATRVHCYSATLSRCVYQCPRYIARQRYWY